MDVPAAAALLADSVRVLAVKDAETPDGRPETARATLPANPFCGVVVMVLVPLAPCAMVRLLGEAERLKSGVGATLALVNVNCDW